MAAKALADLAALPGVSTASALAQAQTTALASGAVLPVQTPLDAVAQLRRGTTVAVLGSTSLLLGLLAEASRTGSWAGVIGMPSLGVAAAAECGVELGRLVLVPRPGNDVAAVIGAVMDGVDLVVVGPAACRAMSAPMAQRLSRRARNRGAVLLATGEWSGADLTLRCELGTWAGGSQDGRGRLDYRDTVVHRTGKTTAGGGRPVSVRLPGPNGTPGPTTETATPATYPPMTVVN
ncbi:hypothetical protein NQK81_01095 [Amycolatopsis roodepoortensis]|uniref:hypothetical protein n=1 Tax=Amycolatopsis roodepoortensis TaxID=700274 RepID=UPI00214AA976|nr:hypothetical protein [Amycolatopsis roodepoortensis]UUV32070.1 hypothetical protein NQK81_01095 [Amycolatopsis roodepoortensis]